MKLILSISTDGKNYKKTDILIGTLEQIDKFTVCFKTKEDLFDSITSDNINNINIKYNIYIESQKGNIKRPIYSEYSFISDPVLFTRAFRKLKYIDPKRIYDYIEQEHYYLLFKNIDEDKYKNNPLYKLAILIEKKNYKPDSEYYFTFTKELENRYYILRDMITKILNKDEILELNGGSYKGRLEPPFIKYN